MIKTRFKDMEVGRIPEEWQLDRIKENFEFKTNNTLSRDTLSDSGIIQDVHYGDVLVKYGSHLDVQKDDVPYISDDGFRASSFISDGDVIIADTAEDETVGKATEVLNVGNNKLVSGLHTMWLHPINQEKYALGYLGYAFNASIYHNQLLPLMQGTKVTSVSKSAIKDTYIVVPSKSEQTRIATALSNVDALISELDKLIEKKRAIKQGAMQQLLTGKKRLKGFSEPWVEKKLGEDATILRGGSPRPIEDYITDSQDGLNWIKIGDVKSEDKYLRKTAEKIKKEGLSKTRQVKKGDLILSNSMSFGRPYILDIDGCIHDGWLVIQDYQEAYDMQFLYYILCSDAIMNQYVSMAAGSSVQNLNKEKVTNVLLYAPTSLQEQSAIASVLTLMDNEISALEAKEAKYEQIKQGMMQQLLTGKIRLVETAAKTNTTSANVHFRRSVLAAEIAERLYEEPTFGHVKMEKMLFLTERLCHIDIGSHYHRDAAGPYDNRALRSIDSQLKKQKWFEVRRIEKGNRYVPMQNRGKHKTYFDKYFSAVLPTFDKIIETFKTQNTERCEIVATLYSAWEDLLHSNKSFTDADIVNEVLNNWHESKKRISQDRWLSAIQWMRENSFAPNV